jgi:hypothetical protein
MNKIKELEELSAEDTDHAIEKIEEVLNADERIESFSKKLVSSIETVPYQSINYSFQADGEEYRLEALYSIGSNEIEKQNIREV